jgi:hypothetical protein
MGENARETIAHQHTWQHKAQAYEKICQQLLSTPGFKSTPECKGKESANEVKG